MNTQNKPVSNNTYSEEGYLIVKVTTASGFIPLENVSVTVKGNDPQNSKIIVRMKTNLSGATEKIRLPAPKEELSLEVSQERQYALYSVEADTKRNQSGNKTG